jgi:hypothetical protein
MEIIKYNIYIGLNDKDSKKQEVSTRIAKEEVIKVLNNNNINGLTMYEVMGVFKHIEDGVIVFEKSLKIELLEVKEEEVIKSIQELKKALNQESILLEKEKKEISFL